MRDITELRDYYLPLKRLDEAAILTNITARHRLRARDIERRKRIPVGLPPSN
ncbi:MAG: hypothetical protein J6386_04455 [Candidatus Synoicihabitans palmerolidicus]|nr:hypothetical protein [Candidatus Synoicihabitans palmerolidicus]